MYTWQTHAHVNASPGATYKEWQNLFCFGVSSIIHEIVKPPSNFKELDFIGNNMGLKLVKGIAWVCEPITK